MDPISAAVTIASTGYSLGSSLFGNNSAANDDQERAQIQQRKDARKLRDSINDYNEESLKVEKENYYNNRDYEFETAIKNWEYGKEIQDFNYQNSLNIYNERLGISQSQIGLNAEAAELGVATTQAAFKDFEIDQAFQREAIYADLENEIINQGFNRETQELKFETIKAGFENELTNLGFDKLQQQANLFGIQSNRRIQTESIQTDLKNLYNKTTFEKEAASIKEIQDAGQAALGQAGKSRGKSIQSAQAESFRTLVQLESALKGSRRSAGIQLLNLNVDSAVRETGLNIDINKIDEATRFARVTSGLQTQQVGIDIARIDQAIKVANEEAEFNNRILKANMDSQIAQTERNIQQIELQKLAQDLQAEAQMSIFPEPLPTLPEPQLGPARTFIAPLKKEPEQVAKGPRIDPLNEALSAGAQVVSFIAGGGPQNIKNLFGPGGGSGVSSFDFGQNNISDFGGATPYNYSLLEQQKDDAQAFGDGGILSFFNK